MAPEIGQKAETAASDYLVTQGFRVLVRNWRNRWCEIDIVAAKAGVIHIVEVKYRSNLDYGSGFDYISVDKLQRLGRAAAMFITSQAPGRPYQIDVLAVTGDLEQPSFDLLENVTG